MLTSDQFDSLSNDILDIYTEYESDVLSDIARRLKNLDFASAAWQAQRITESGAVFQDVLKQLSKLTGKSESEIANILTRAGVKAIQFDDKIYKEIGLEPLPLNLSPAMANVLKATLDKTNGVMNNLTKTTAITAQQSFLRAADIAHQQVATGTMSYDEAIRAAIKKTAANGLDVIDYSTGHQDKLDVAMRRTVLTGVAQTTNQLQLTRAEEMGSDLVAVSAHAGARNKGVGPANHESWQGKIYSRSGTHKKYPPFVETTGYGTGEGLGGWNCVIGETLVSSPAIRAAYRRQYSGEIIIIHTARGKKLSVTPNHPILTDHGWVAAKFLRHGDNVISRSNSYVSFRASPNINQSEARIENVFESLCVSGMVFRFPASAGHFHGEISDSEVNIVFPNSLLRDGIDTLIEKKSIKIGFSLSSSFSQSLIGEGAFTQTGVGLLHSPNSIMGFFGKCKAIFSRHSLKSFGNRIRTTFSKWYSELCEIFSYRAFRYASLGGDFIFPHTGIVHSKKIIGTNTITPLDIRFPIGSVDVNTQSNQSVLNSLSGTSESIRDFISGYAGIVETDQIVFIERESAQSSFIHVYNLETEGGWYYANDIITHNCRHSFYPYFENVSENIYSKSELKSLKNQKVKYQDQQIDLYTATQYQRAMERKIRYWKRITAALDAAKLDSKSERAKISYWQAAMRDFIRATGLDRQYVREQVL